MGSPMPHLMGSVDGHIQPLSPTPTVLNTPVPTAAWQEGVGTINAASPIACPLVGPMKKDGLKISLMGMRLITLSHQTAANLLCPNGHERVLRG